MIPQPVTHAVASLPWSTIGKVALLVGGAALTIGSQGQTKIKVVIDAAGKIITSYPVK